MKKLFLTMSMVAASLVAMPSHEASAQQGQSVQKQLERQQQIAENARLEVERLRKELLLRDELIDLGIERNAELYAIVVEIIEKGLSKKSLEPFLQLKRVEIENLKQDYEDRARAARIYESTLPPSVQEKMEEALQETKD
ncbi:hypothetical protein [Hyphococcus sp. DH-69]|uniref:hypothetical protein n=1 Tax=Hyphococcus formosus TaxID=3143534 RepID=UPI00398AAEC5